MKAGQLFNFKKEYFLFLLPVFFVLHGVEENFPSIDFSDAITLVLSYLGWQILFFVISYFIIKSTIKASLFSFYLMGVEFFFGIIKDTLKQITPNGFASKYSVLLPTITVLTIIILIVLYKSKNKFKNLIGYLTITLVTLVLIDFCTLIIKESREKDFSGEHLFINDVSSKPNIYLILLDEYAGSKELKTIFSFDNSFFTNQLIQRNFWTVSKSRSNYNYTPFSMASLLSMDYLHGISLKSNDNKNRSICYQTINQNQLISILKKLGYKFFNLSLFDFADQPSLLSNNFYATHTKIITDQTLTSKVYSDLWFHLITNFHFNWAKDQYLHTLKNNIRIAYEKTIELSKKNNSPKFTYAHFIMPHYPYLFDSAGKELPFELAVNDSRKDLYLGYLKYANKLSLSLVDSIQKNDVNAIILLMSDHGFTKYINEYKPEYNFQNIINIYLPNKNYTSFPDSLTNVNLFRTLLNTQFNLKLPTLKDSTIFLKEY